MATTNNGVTYDPTLYTVDIVPENVTINDTDPTLIVPLAPTLPTILATSFVSVAEMNTHIYTGIVNAIADGGTSQLPAAIAAAIQEAMGYMSRYDFSTILQQTGNARDPILLQYIKDIAVWHFIVLANPNIDYELRLDRYKHAIKWLEKVQRGDVAPPGWPIPAVAQANNLWHIKSMNKRGNNF